MRQSERDVANSDEGAPRERSRRMTEDDGVSSSVGRGTQESLVVGVAADDPVQHDDIGNCDILGGHGEIDTRVGESRDRRLRPR